MSSSESRRGPRGLVVGVGLWLCAACTAGLGPEHDPRPARLLPSVGLDTAPVAVTIEGENFLAFATQRLGEGPEVEVASRYEARLGDTPLEAVVRVDEQHLHAVVPSGLAPGWHALTLVGPLGRAVVLPDAWFSTDRTLAHLRAHATLDAPAPLPGQAVRLHLVVDNLGQTSALGVAPALALSGDGRVAVVEAPAPADVGPGQQVSFAWTLRAEALGQVLLSPRARGQDAALAREVAVAVEPLSLQVRAALGLACALGASPSRLNVGGTVTLALEVVNEGTLPVRAVAPSVPGVSGASAVLVSGPTPQGLELAGGARGVFSWEYRADAEGALSFEASAAGWDEASGTVLEAPLAHSASLTVQRPAALAATLAAPPAVREDSLFDMVLTVTNPGGASAVGVVPGPLSCEGSAQPVVQQAPAEGAVEVPGGASHALHWTLVARKAGTLRCTASAEGLDGNDGRALRVGPVASGEVRVGEVDLLGADPLGDGTAFSFVLSHGGRLYLGPNRTGRGGVRMAPDGSGAESFTWLLPGDTVGNKTANARPPPYPSVGAAGCVKDSYDCGPDNENGRGLLFSGSLGGAPWLGLVGANTAGDVDYLYLTQDTDAQLDFRFVDLDAAPLGGQTRGGSSAHFFQERLYLGFPDTGGNRPYLVVLNRPPPSAPGLDALPPEDALSLDAEKFPGLGSSGTPSNRASVVMIDTVASFNERLYVANNGGCMRATTATPRPYGSFPADWASCTPSLLAYGARASHTPLKTADLEPVDKAVPALAAFGGRLYLGRNTTVGPQLFACSPGVSGDPRQCDTGDWTLVAPNTAAGLDGLLTQFNNPANTSLTLLVASAQHLYVGFNNTQDGVVLLRSQGNWPSTTADFHGRAGCAASQHPTACVGLGGSGLGVGATRFFDARALGFGGVEAVYLTAGDGLGPVRLLRLVD